jgi:hypothetical protein
VELVIPADRVILLERIRRAAFDVLLEHLVGGGEAPNCRRSQAVRSSPAGELMGSMGWSPTPFLPAIPRFCVQTRTVATGAYPTLDAHLPWPPGGRRPISGPAEAKRCGDRGRVIRYESAPAPCRVSGP